MGPFLAVLALVLAVPAAAQAAPEVVASEQAPFTAAARGGLIAWSSFDPAEKTYALRLRSDGVTSTPPIAPRRAPFDVDLGRGPGGGTVAVYSRDDGDLYLYDPAKGTERRVASASDPAHPDTQPSVDGDSIAFVRTVGDVARLYVGAVRGAPRSARQALPRGVRSIGDLELAAGRALFVANVSDGEFGSSTLYRARGARAPLRLYATRSGGANFSQVIGPGSDGRRVYFAETNQGSGAGNRLYRTTFDGGQRVEVRGSSRYSSLDWTGDRFLLAKAPEGCDDGRPSCTLELGDPPGF